MSAPDTPSVCPTAPDGYVACRTTHGPGASSTVQVTHLVRLDDSGSNGGRPTMCGLTRFDKRSPDGWDVIELAAIPRWSMGDGGISGPGITQKACQSCWSAAAPAAPGSSSPDTAADDWMVELTSSDPEPETYGTLVVDVDGGVWERTDKEGTRFGWSRVDDWNDDPRSWIRLAGNHGPVRLIRPLEAQAARITELEAEREALRRFALQQHIAIGALRRIHGGNRLFDDTGAERLWMFGESDKGWALIEEPTTPTEETE